MNVGDLRKVLGDLASILRAGSARAASSQVAALETIFDGRDSRPVSEFLDELEQGLSEPAVDRYVRQLRKAGTEKQAFDAVFVVLSSDASVTKRQADEIAHQFIGYAEGRTKWPSKAAAFQAISDWFKHTSHDAVKMRQVEKARYAG